MTARDLLAGLCALGLVVVVGWSAAELLDEWRYRRRRAELARKLCRPTWTRDDALRRWEP